MILSEALVLCPLHTVIFCDTTLLLSLINYVTSPYLLVFYSNHTHFYRFQKIVFSGKNANLYNRYAYLDNDNTGSETYNKTQCLLVAMVVLGPYWNSYLMYNINS